MSKIIFIFILCIAIQACNEDQTVYAYLVAKSTLEERDISEWRPVMRVIYRVGEINVISEVAGLLDEYQNCEIEDKNNWQCQYEDGTGLNQFGFKSGKYWQEPGWGEDTKHVSRWKYNLIRCKWYQHEKGRLEGVKSCIKTYI